MPKYYFAPEQLQDSKITLLENTAHHLLHVLRITVGDKIVLCNGANMDYHAVVTELLSKSKQPGVRLEVQAAVPSATEPRTKVTLYQSVPKGDKMDTIIQKCVELGVLSIVPVITERSVVRKKETEKKASRYHRIAESAAGQSMRGIIPTIHTAISFEEAVKSMNTSELSLVAYEGERKRSLKNTLREYTSSAVNLWIGPEGGFAPEEIAVLQEKQAVTVSLGPRILRTETAAIAMLAQVLYEIEC